MTAAAFAPVSAVTLGAFSYLADSGDVYVRLLRETADATVRGSKEILHYLRQAGIEFVSICPSNTWFTTDMDPQCTAYDLTDGDGRNHVLVLGEHNRFCAVMDNEGELEFGYTDSDMFPSLPWSPA